MKILAGIDGTERSYHALEFASGLLSPKIDDIHLYYSPPKIMLRSTPDVSADLVDLARDALAKSVFEIATNRLPSAFQSLVGTTTGTSKAYEGVLSAAEKERADLVVIGSHRTRRSFPLLLGGNARKIAHHSTLPVLMVRSRQAEPTVGMRVLIACDEHEAWRPAAEFLKAFSWPEATNATLFNVVEMLTDEEVDQLAENSVGVPDSDKLIAEYRASSEKQKASRLKHLAETHASLPSIVRDATPKIGEGHVVEAIVREVLESDIDLVVVGARKLSALGRLFGSTTEGLLAHCPCSLLIVHEFEKP